MSKNSRITHSKMVGCKTFDDDSNLVHSMKAQYGMDKLKLTFDFGTVAAITAGDSAVTIPALCELATAGVIIQLQAQQRRLALSTLPNPAYSFDDKKAYSVADILSAERKTGQNREARDKMVVGAEQNRIVERLVNERGMTREEALDAIS